MNRLFRQARKTPASKAPENSSVPTTASTTILASNSFPSGIKLLYESDNSIVE
jgi:hypothetical protein